MNQVDEFEMQVQAIYYSVKHRPSAHLHIQPKEQFDQGRELGGQPFHPSSNRLKIPALHCAGRFYWTMIDKITLFSNFG